MSNPYRTPQANLLSQTNVHPSARWGFWMTCVWWLVWLVTTQILLSGALILGFLLSQNLPINKASINLVVQDMDVLMSVALIVNLLSFPLIVWMVKSKRGSRWREYMAWQPVSVWHLLLWVGICMGSVIFMGKLHEFLGWPQTDFMSKMAMSQSPIWLIVSVALVAPLFEEMVFRGFVYAGFERALGALPAVLLSTCLFTAMHVQYNMYELMQVLILGLMLTLARWHTQSLWTPIIVHTVNNSLALVTVFLAKH